MQKYFLAYKKDVFEKVKPGFAKIEEYNSRRQAEKKAIRYRREGLYFTFSILEEGKWKVYVG